MSSTPDDLRRIFLGSTLFRLDTLVASRLIPILYAVGLVGILVWAINHLFATFSRNFGDGLWGIVEIAVFGLLWLLILRLACEALMVFFRTHDAAVHSMRSSRMSATLLEDVRDAIHDLAEEEDTHIAATITEPARSVRRPKPPAPPAPPAAEESRAGGVRRTARRTPPAPPPPAAVPPTLATPSAAPATGTTPAAPPATPAAPPPPATPPARPEDDDV
jgi:hypothetical protein